MKITRGIVIRNWAVAALAGIGLASLAHAGPFEDELAAIQHDWAAANYSMQDRSAKVAAFEKLVARATAFAEANPDRAEPLVWQGIVYSTFAGAKGGLGAMGLAKKARAALEAAEKMDPAVLDGSVYASLGTLYAKVPGWPIGFGDDRRAEEYLKKALEVNPHGIDPNYFYGEFLLEHGDRDRAVTYLERGLQAPPRPGREDADAGRRTDIEALLAKTREKA